MKVLIVDDNKNDRLLLFKMLTSNNYEVQEAANGIEALEAIRAAKPDLIISDIMMPGMDGFTLLHRLNSKDMLDDIPFVFYTAHYVSGKDRELAEKLGASRFIVKPVEPMVFLHETEAVLEEYKAGHLKSKEVLVKAEEEYLKMYSEHIFKKLEDKVGELEDANMKLKAEIDARKKAEDKIRMLNEQLEQRVRERTAELEKMNSELERMNKLFVGRELRVVELKKQVAELEKQIGYKSEKGGSK